MLVVGVSCQQPVLVLASIPDLHDQPRVVATTTSGALQRDYFAVSTPRHASRAVWDDQNRAAGLQDLACELRVGRADATALGAECCAR